MIFLSDFFHNFYQQIITMVIAAMPVGELRLAIPFALNYFHLPAIQVYFLAVIGNMAPVFLIIYFLSDLTDYLYKKSKFFHKFFHTLFKRTRKKFNHHYDKYGMIVLVLFVAIPLPMTGAWTAALAAWIFEFPKLKSVFYIFIGILIAGVVMTLASMGVTNFFNIEVKQ